MEGVHSRCHHLKLRQPILFHLEVFFTKTESCHDVCVFCTEPVRKEGMMGEVITSVFNKNNVVRRKKKGTSAQLPTDIPQDPEPVTGKRLSTCSVIRALAATAGILSISLSFFYFCFFFSSLALLCTHISRERRGQIILPHHRYTHMTPAVVRGRLPFPTLTVAVWLGRNAYRRYILTTLQESFNCSRLCHLSSSVFL